MPDIRYLFDTDMACGSDYVILWRERERRQRVGGEVRRTKSCILAIRPEPDRIRPHALSTNSPHIRTAERAHGLDNHKILPVYGKPIIVALRGFGEHPGGFLGLWSTV